MDLGHFLGGSMLLMVLVGIAWLALILWALVDLAGRPMEATTKVLWVLGIFIFPFLGSPAYLIVGRSMRGTAV